MELRPERQNGGRDVAADRAEAVDARVAGPAQGEEELRAGEARAAVVDHRLPRPAAADLAVGWAAWA